MDSRASRRYPGRKKMGAGRSSLEALRELLARRSMRHGDFVLASGDRSTWYFDSKATLLSPEGAALAGGVVFDVLRGDDVAAVGGLAMGATFITTAVALTSSLRGAPIYGFNVRGRSKEHGLETSIDQSFHPDGRPLLCPGRRVAIVEDVVTKGGSVVKAIEAVRALECQIVRVVAIVDRQAGGGERLRADGLSYLPLFRADADGTLHVDDAARAACAAATPGSSP